MLQLKLTPQIIESDIEAYTARIVAAKMHLESLPATADNWKDRKKLKARRKALADEITHVKKLIVLAREALSELCHEQEETKV